MVTIDGWTLELKITGKEIVAYVHAGPDGEDWIKGEVFGRLTTYDPTDKTTLKGDEFLVKTWSENSRWAPKLLGVRFKDTGKRVKVGYAEAQVWQLI